jgi:DASS family divalent anion:Na+ symporter
MYKPSLPKLAPTAVAGARTLLIWVAIFVPDKVSPEAWHLLALFIGTIAATILKTKSAWDTLIWFAALVMMAIFLGKLGLVSWFALSIRAERNALPGPGFSRV